MFLATRCLSSRRVLGLVSNQLRKCATQPQYKSNYPTRCRLNKFIPRVDHVVWPSASGKPVSGPLSTDQLNEFAQRGYLLLEGMYSNDEVEMFRERLRKIQEDHGRNLAEDVRVTENSRVVSEVGTRKIKSVFGVHKHEFKDILYSERHAQLGRQILGGDIYLYQSRLNMAPAFDGRGFEWHQDFETWHSEDGLPLPRTFSCVVYLQDTMPQNGALMVVPGSHMTLISCPDETPEYNWENSLQTMTIGVPDPELITELANKNGIVHCTGKAGTVLLFDTLLLHGSHSNRSPWGRANLFAVYNSVDNRPGAPFYSPMHRPEHLCTRDPAWTHAL